MLEDPITSTPGLGRTSIGRSSNDSIRRRSLIPQIARSHDEARNDDDAERSSLISTERAVASPKVSSAASRESEDTLSSSQQKEHFQGCLKLYAENKITKDNAWNLQLIDFMATMLRRHDSRMENLQTASTVIDASARIYSFRVDAVHHEVLKMAGGLTKVAQSKRGKKDDNAADDGPEGSEQATQAKKKKKRMRGAIATKLETLNGDFDTNEFIDPFFERLAATSGDVTSSNRSFNATLPINDKTMALILRTDGPFLEQNKENIPESIDLSSRITLATKLVPRFEASDHICEPFTGFSICNWDPDTEESEFRTNNWVESNRLNLSQQALAFDVNADVEPVPTDEPHNDLYDEEPLGGIESEEEGDVAVAACVARVAPAPAGRLTDMRPGAASDARLEYSYCAAIVSAWAGPAHWKLKNNRAASRTSERVTQSTAADGKRAPRTKKQLDFLGAGMAFEPGSDPDYEVPPPAKIVISRKTLVTGHTWNEANYKTPVDRGLEECRFRALWSRRGVALQPARRAPADPLTVDAARDYDYDNENDASYCPAAVTEGEEWANEEGRLAGALHQQTLPRAQHEDITEMIEPPAKVPKIFIPYAMRAKKIDMKQLKRVTWHTLAADSADSDHEHVAGTTFSKLYSTLPNKLSTNSRESLSVPLALLSVLHLANEKGLVLGKRDDMRDFAIIGLLK